MKKFNKPNAGAVWTVISIGAALIGAIASNKKEASTMDAIAEKAADLVEKRNSGKQ